MCRNELVTRVRKGFENLRRRNNGKKKESDERYRACSLRRRISQLAFSDRFEKKREMGVRFVAKSIDEVNIINRKERKENFKTRLRKGVNETKVSLVLERILIQTALYAKRQMIDEKKRKEKIVGN